MHVLATPFRRRLAFLVGSGLAGGLVLGAPVLAAYWAFALAGANETWPNTWRITIGLSAMWLIGLAVEVLLVRMLLDARYGPRRWQ
jgi:hypothetical protein